MTQAVNRTTNRSPDGSGRRVVRNEERNVVMIGPRAPDRPLFDHARPRDGFRGHRGAASATWEDLGRPGKQAQRIVVMELYDNVALGTIGCCDVERRGGLPALARAVALPCGLNGRCVPA
jgi:hypothetical protein